MTAGHIGMLAIFALPIILSTASIGIASILLNTGIYYEFIELDEMRKEDPKRLTIQEVELNTSYVLIVSTSAGLWGYNTGDTVSFVSLNPRRIIVTGRYKHFISAFGEHVIGSEVEKALSFGLKKHKANIFVREFMEQPSLYFLGAGAARPKPEGALLAEYQSYIDFEVEFDQAYNWLRLPRSVLHMEQKHGNKLAHQLYRVQAYELLRKFYPSSDDVVAQSQQIIGGYDAHYPSVPEVAGMFGISERTYRRKLGEANITYRELLDEHKKKRCLDILSGKHIAVSELAETLGYAESASFLRAFKRWTGLTPKQYVKAGR